MTTRGREELRLGGEEGKKRGRMAGRLAWLAPQPPRDHATGAPLGQVEEGPWISWHIGLLSGARGNKRRIGNREMFQEVHATAKPPAGVPRRSSLALWSLEGALEFRRSRLRAFSSSVGLVCRVRNGFSMLRVDARYLVYPCFALALAWLALANLQIGANLPIYHAD